jgi:hypothetical protein
MRLQVQLDALVRLVAAAAAGRSTMAQRISRCDWRELGPLWYSRRPYAETRRVLEEIMATMHVP